MKRFSKFLYKNYVNKNSKILNIEPVNFDLYDYMLSVGHNSFNLITLTTDEKIYEECKSKKIFCIYGDLYDKLSHNIEENEYDLVLATNTIPLISKLLSEIYWILKNDKILIAIITNTDLVMNNWMLKEKYKKYLVFQRKYI